MFTTWQSNNGQFNLCAIGVFGTSVLLQQYIYIKHSVRWELPRQVYFRKRERGKQTKRKQFRNVYHIEKLSHPQMIDHLILTSNNFIHATHLSNVTYKYKNAKSLPLQWPRNIVPLFTHFFFPHSLFPFYYVGAYTRNSCAELCNSRFGKTHFVISFGSKRKIFTFQWQFEVFHSCCCSCCFFLSFVLSFPLRR